MEKILLMLFAITLLIISIVCLYLSYRIDKVSLFKSQIIRLCLDYNLRHLLDQEETTDSLEWFDKYTAEEMLYSLKPLKLEAWYTPEEIEKIKS